MVILISFILLLPSFVSAQNEVVEQIKQVGAGIWDVVEPLAAWLLGDIPGGEYLFAKLIFFLIILVGVWVVLDKIDFISEHTWAMVLLSIVIPTLSIRYIATAELITLALTYSISAVTILSIAPLAAAFFGIEFGLKNQILTIRRVIWGFLLFFFTGFLLSRLYSGDTGITLTVASIYDIGWVTFIAMVFCLFMIVWGSKMMGKVNAKIGIEKGEREVKRNERMSLLEQRRQVIAARTAGDIDQNDFESAMDSINERLEDVMD